jgi:hypothetical protein
MRRARGLDEDTVRLERIGDAHDRARGPHPVAERRHPPVGLLPDLAAEVVAMVRDDVRVAIEFTR